MCVFNIYVIIISKTDFYKKKVSIAHPTNTKSMSNLEMLEIKPRQQPSLLWVLPDKR